MLKEEIVKTLLLAFYELTVNVYTIGQYVTSWSIMWNSTIAVQSDGTGLYYNPGVFSEYITLLYYYFCGIIRATFLTLFKLKSIIIQISIA